MKVTMLEFQKKNRDVMITLQLPLRAIFNASYGLIIYREFHESDTLVQAILEVILCSITAQTLEQFPEYESYLALLSRQKSPENEECK